MGEYTWKVLIRSAILPGGALWFPERLTEEFLESQRKRDPYLFACLYQNNPVPPEDQRFRPEWVVYKQFKYEWELSPRVIVKSTGQELPVYVSTCIDPAISDRKYADYTGITTIGTDPDGVWWVFSARRIRGGVDKIAEACVQEVREFRPHAFGIETVAFQIALKSILRDRFDEHGLITGIKELKSGSHRGKRTRIEALVPRFSQGEVFLKQGIGGELEEELREWRPDSDMKHDDLIDSLSHQGAIASPAPRKGLTTPIVDIFDLPPDERERYRRRREGSGRDKTTGY